MTSLSRIVYQYNHNLSQRLVSKANAYDDTEDKNRKAREMEEVSDHLERILERGSDGRKL